MPSHPLDTIIIGVLHEFLQYLIEQNDETIAQLTDIETYLSTLYAYIWPWVWTTLENMKTQIRLR